MSATKNFGFTLVEIMIVVAVIGLLVTMAVPSFLKARNTSQQNACINNLRVIDGGKEQCAMVFRLTAGDSVAVASVNEYIKSNTTPVCPTSGIYTYGNIGSNPRCSISAPTSHQFVGGQ